MSETIQVAASGSSKRVHRSAEEKRRIVEATLVPGASIVRVARENGVNANQVFQWLYEYKSGVGNRRFADLIVSRAKQFHLGDNGCPLAYEPSGEDFLSPCLGEADLMRRVLSNEEFAHWLEGLMPQIANGTRLRPGRVA